MTAPIPIRQEKWTEGPWLREGRHVYAPGPNGANVATVSEPRSSSILGYHELKIASPDAEEAYANARLISAAPELYDALKAVLVDEQRRREQLKPGSPAHSFCTKRIADAEAALAKARGETS